MAFVRYYAILDCESLIHADFIPLFVIHVWRLHFPLNGIKKYLTYFDLWLKKGVLIDNSRVSHCLIKISVFLGVCFCCCVVVFLTFLSVLMLMVSLSLRSRFFVLKSPASFNKSRLFLSFFVSS